MSAPGRSQALMPELFKGEGTPVSTERSIDAPPAAGRLAEQALAVFAAASRWLGGVHVRGPAGPQREAWLRALRAAQGEDSPWCPLPPHAADDVLDGGLDLAATLASGRPVHERGLIERARGGVVVALMAERIGRARAARLALAIDEADGDLAVVALDEGEGEDESLPQTLCERLALQVRPPRDAPRVDAAAVAQGRAGWREVVLTDAIIEVLAQAAWALGIGSSRALWQALCVARVSAAMRGARQVEAGDATLAAQLVFAHRASRLPAADEDPPAGEDDPAPADAPRGQEDGAPDGPAGPLPDQVVASVRAAIPPGLLAQLASGRHRPPRRGDAGRVGERSASVQRGRPIGTRPGTPRGGARLALVETLRAAAPWQRLRQRAGQEGRVLVRRDDLRVQRRQQRRGTTTIFAIDASGSQAAHRLAEAKGAVELLLADCYARRDRVAVIGFRGSRADVLLAPTRSLVRAKRQLAGLPGGGGTPLAAGIEAAAAMAASVRRAGSTPLVVLLTDGKANVGRSGEPGRAAAAADALAAARLLASTGTAALVIDSSPQPGLAAPALAAALHGRCVALPYAGAQAVSQAVRHQRSGAVAASDATARGARP